MPEIINEEIDYCENCDLWDCEECPYDVAREYVDLDEDPSLW